MSRLIDADLLMKTVFDDIFLVNGEVKGVGLILAETVDKVPTIDAVPVVRCRECKHRGTDDCIFHIKGEPADEELLLKLDNDFCPYGDRKEGAD